MSCTYTVNLKAKKGYWILQEKKNMSHIRQDYQDNTRLFNTDLKPDGLDLCSTGSKKNTDLDQTIKSVISHNWRRKKNFPKFKECIYY